MNDSQDMSQPDDDALAAARDRYKREREKRLRSDGLAPYSQLDDYDEYVIDAGRGYTFSDWTESREEAIASASPAAAALLASSYDYPPGYAYIDDAPEGWPFEDSEARA